MIVSCKCAHCGFISMSKDDQITIEVDFLEQRILAICPQCKKQNLLDLSDEKKRRKTQPLPPSIVT